MGKVCRERHMYVDNNAHCIVKGLSLHQQFKMYMHVYVYVGTLEIQDQNEELWQPFRCQLLSVVDHCPCHLSIAKVTVYVICLLLM